MRLIFLIGALCITSHTAFRAERISTIEFVEVLNNNKEEAIYYYKNNWEELRKKAIKRKYIEDYELLETEPTEDMPVSFILITTYSNHDQFAKREEHFRELMQEGTGLKLLNEKKPGDFRKTIFSRKSRHINK